MSAITESGANVFQPQGTDLETSQLLSIVDVESIIIPGTDQQQPVTGLQVVEKQPERVMQIQVEPSGLAHYSLEAVLRDGRRAMLFPMNKPQEGKVVGISPLPAA